MAIDKNLMITANDHIDAELDRDTENSALNLAANNHITAELDQDTENSAINTNHDLTTSHVVERVHDENVQNLDDDGSHNVAADLTTIKSRGPSDDYPGAKAPPDRDRLEKTVGEPVNEDEIDNIETDPDKTKGLPIDRGWAWVVLAGSTFYLMLFGGIRKNFGIFFVAFQSRFDSSASLTSTLNTMQNLVMSTSSLLIMTVGMRYLSGRMSIMLGSVFLTTANIITAFARDIRLLFVSVGFLEGAGTALVHPSVTAVLGEYFHERRGFANGLAFSGASFGGLVFAPIMSALFEHYGYTGTLMIVAGMTLNILITGSLLRPISSFEQKKKQPSGQTIPAKDQKNAAGRLGLTYDDNGKEESEKLMQPNGNDTVCVFQDDNSKFTNSKQETENILKKLVQEKEDGTLKVLPNTAVLQLKSNGVPALKVFRSDSYNVENRSLHENMTSSPLLPRMRTWSVGRTSEENKQQRTNIEVSQTELLPFHNLVESLSRSRVALYSSADGICGSVINIQEIPCENDDSNVQEKEMNFCSKLKASFDVSLFKNPVFPIFLLMAAMFAPTCGLLPVFLAPLSKDIGITAEQTGILLSIVGGVGMFSRIMCALFADRKYIRLTTLLAVTGSIAALAAHCVRFFNSFGSLVFMAVVLGLCCEIYQSMYPVILVEYLTLPKLKSCIGFTVLCHGLAVAGTFPMIGTLRDVTGDYHASYHFLGAMSLTGAALALLIPYIHQKRITRSSSFEVKP